MKKLLVALLFSLASVQSYAWQQQAPKAVEFYYTGTTAASVYLDLVNVK